MDIENKINFNFKKELQLHLLNKDKESIKSKRKNK